MKWHIHYRIFVFLLAFAKCQAADNFDSATVLSGEVASHTESNSTATLEAGEPFSDTYRTLWWKWTAPRSGRVNVSTVGSDPFRKVLGVFLAKSEPPQINSLAIVNFTESTAPALNFPVVTGTTYYIQASSFYSSTSGVGSVKITVALDSETDINQLNIQGPGLVSNDFFAQRATLTGLNASSVAYAYSATTEPAANEPGNGSHTVWWTWKAPANGRVTISTVGSATNRKYLSVFLGSQLNSLRWLAWTEDSEPTLTLPVTQNQTYQIAIGSYYSASPPGAMVLTLDLNTDTDINSMNLTTLATAANDLFANRVALTGADVSAIGYGLEATREGVEPEQSGSRTLWWTYTAPSDAVVKLSLQGSSGTARRYLTVWTGSSLGSLQLVKQEENSLPSLSFTATVGQIYQISVGGYYAAGPGTVVLTLAGPPDASDAPVTGLEISQAVRLRWPTVEGAGYRLKTSNDLKTWSDLGPLITGDGTIQELYQPVAPGKKFFRIYNP